MHVFRDTHFSRDRAPYKTNVGIQFRHELGKDVHAPGFYLHIATYQFSEYVVLMGTRMIDFAAINAARP